MSIRTPPTLLQLAGESLLRDQASVITALEYLSAELFPLLFIQAYRRRIREPLKAMVHAWPFTVLPLGCLSQLSLDQVLKAVLDGLDVLLAQEVCPRRWKLRVLDLRNTGANFWRMWCGDSTRNCSPAGPVAVHSSSPNTEHPLAPLEVFLDLNFNERDGDEFLKFIIQWAQQREGLLHLCCKTLRISEVPFQRVGKVLDGVQLDCIQEVEVNYTWDLPTLGTFARYLGQMRNLQRLSLSHIHVLTEEEDREEEDVEEEEMEEEEDAEEEEVEEEEGEEVEEEVEEQEMKEEDREEEDVEEVEEDAEEEEEDVEEVEEDVEEEEEDVEEEEEDAEEEEEDVEEEEEEDVEEEEEEDVEKEEMEEEEGEEVEEEVEEQEREEEDVEEEEVEEEEDREEEGEVEQDVEDEDGEEEEEEEEEQEREEEEDWDRKQEEQQFFSQFLSQMLRLQHLRDLKMDSPSFLRGRLDQMLRCLQTPLDRLSITNCQQLKHSDLTHLFQCPNLRQLKSLHLFGLSLVDFSPEPLRALLEAVAPTLQDLGLDNCGMVDSQVEAILPVLSRCHQLRDFTIPENNFSVGTVEKLLRHTAGLCSLELELYPVPLECYRVQGTVNKERLALIRAELVGILRELGQPRTIFLGTKYCHKCGNSKVYEVEFL